MNIHIAFVIVYIIFDFGVNDNALFTCLAGLQRSSYGYGQCEDLD